MLPGPVPTICVPSLSGQTGRFAKSTWSEQIGMLYGTLTHQWMPGTSQSRMLFWFGVHHGSISNASSWHGSDADSQVSHTQSRLKPRTYFGFLSAHGRGPRPGGKLFFLVSKEWAAKPFMCGTSPWEPCEGYESSDLFSVKGDRDATAATSCT